MTTSCGPGRFGALLFKIISGKYKVYQSTVNIRLLDSHVDPVAQSEDLSSLSSNDAVVLFIELIEVVCHVRHADHSLAFRFNDLNVNTPFGHTGDQAFVVFLLRIGHELHLFVFD